MVCDGVVECTRDGWLVEISAQRCDCNEESASPEIFLLFLSLSGEGGDGKEQLRGRSTFSPVTADREHLTSASASNLLSQDITCHLQ